MALNLSYSSNSEQLVLKALRHLSSAQVLLPVVVPVICVIFGHTNCSYYLLTYLLTYLYTQIHWHCFNGLFPDETQPVCLRIFFSICSRAVCHVATKQKFSSTPWHHPTKSLLHHASLNQQYLYTPNSPSHLNRPFSQYKPTETSFTSCSPYTIEQP